MSDDQEFAILTRYVLRYRLNPALYWGGIYCPLGHLRHAELYLTRNGAKRLASKRREEFDVVQVLVTIEPQEPVE